MKSRFIVPYSYNPEKVEEKEEERKGEKHCCFCRPSAIESSRGEGPLGVPSFVFFLSFFHFRILGRSTGGDKSDALHSLIRSERTKSVRPYEKAS